MKKFNFTFAITATLLAIFFVLTAAFAVGDVVSPRSYWLSQIKRESTSGAVLYAEQTIDLNRRLPKKDEQTGEESDVAFPVGRVYVFIGKAYETSADGKIKIFFDFKTDSVYTSETAARIVEKDIPVSGSNCQYRWYKVYDATEEGESGISYSRVKIRTPDIFDFYEVVFTDVDGRIMKATGVTGDKLVDEQYTFKDSDYRAYVLSSYETAELAAVDGFLSGTGIWGSAPLSTVLNSVGVLIFGKNTFGIRIMSMIAAFVALLLLYSLAEKLFSSGLAAAISVGVALFGGTALFAASSASGAFGLLFMILAYNFAVKFYIDDYNYKRIRYAAYNILLTGLFLGLAVSSGSYYLLAAVGIIAIWIISILKAYKKYKADEKAAVGLGKEEVYVEWRKRVYNFAWLMAVAVIVLPLIIEIIFYGITAKSLTSYYDANFFSAMFTDFANGYKIDYAVNPFGLLIGMGSYSVGNAHAISNYVTAIVSILSLICVTALMFVGGNGKLKAAKNAIRNKYKLSVSLLIGSLLPALLGMGQPIVGFALSSAMLSLFVPMLVTAAGKIVRQKTINICLCVFSAVAFITFVGCYFGIFGFGINGVLANILYGWQI